MNTRRMAARKLEGGRVNKEIPPQVAQVEKALQGDEGAQVSKEFEVPI